MSMNQVLIQAKSRMIDILRQQYNDNHITIRVLMTEINYLKHLDAHGMDCSKKRHYRVVR